MKITQILFLLFLFCASFVAAQNVYQIPIGTKDNSIAISVKNTTATAIENIVITAVNLPDWIQFVE